MKFLLIFLIIFLFHSAQSAQARGLDEGDRPNNSAQNLIKECEDRNKAAANNIQSIINKIQEERKAKVDLMASLEERNQFLSMKSDEFFGLMQNTQMELFFQKNDLDLQKSKKNIIKNLLHAFDENSKTDKILTHYYLAGEEKTHIWQKNKSEAVLKIIENRKKNIEYELDNYKNEINTNNLKVPIIKEQIYKIQLNVNENQSLLSKFSYMIIQGCKENPSG